MLWHRREARRQTEKTKLNLNPEKPAYSTDFQMSTNSSLTPPLPLPA
jgi:hypothetical protein